MTSGESGSARRREAGLFVRRLREDAGLTQQEVAKRTGLAYYTMVSQIEHGKARIPPDRIEAWALALGANPRDFARQLLRFYDPPMWDLLFAPGR